MGNLSSEISTLLLYLYQLLAIQLHNTNTQPETPDDVSDELGSEDEEDRRTQQDFLIYETGETLLNRRAFRESEIGLRSGDGIREAAEYRLQTFDKQLAELSVTARDAADISEMSYISKGSNDSEGPHSSYSRADKVYQNAVVYANKVVKYGDYQLPQGSFVPVTTEALSQAVNESKALNIVMNQGNTEESLGYDGDFIAESKANAGLGKDLECLYTLLANRPGQCLSIDHHALLQLPKAGERHPFHMFLSTCPGDDTADDRPEWHETSCSMVRTGQGDGNNQMDICYQVRYHQDYQQPLFISFSESQLWIDQQPTTNRIISHGSDSQTKLADVFNRGCLKTTAIEPLQLPAVMLAKAQLALHLAICIFQLYPGPWLPDSWAADKVYFYLTQGGDILDDLSNPLLHCALQNSWKASSTVRHHHAATQACPPFFLSFAQLLLDLEKGSQKTGIPRALKVWQKHIYKELEQSLHDPIFDEYKKAVRGCLGYSLSLGRIREGNLTQRAQSVICSEIVRPLRKNWTMWKMENERQCNARLSAGITEQQQAARRDQLPKPREQPLPNYEQKTGPRRPRRKFPTNQPGPYFVEGEFMLFDDAIGASGNSVPTDPDTETFTNLMDHFIMYLHYLEEFGSENNIRIAVLDTGICLDPTDEILDGGKSRIILKRGFIGAEDQHSDSYGHGTHIVRLLLRFAPFADIVVAKVAEDHALTTTQVSHIVEALRWAGGNGDDEGNADIIIMSFGLGSTSIPEICAEINALVHKNKLIFAAASNGGGNGCRAFPANNPGVFAIHAATGDGAKWNKNPPLEHGDNFSTLGVAINSKWKGNDINISGTSFATPVAAAIAANILEFTTHTLIEEDDKPEFFHSFLGMKTLFDCLKVNIDGYDYIKPWHKGLWEQLEGDKRKQFQAVCDELRYIATHGERKSPPTLDK